MNWKLLKAPLSASGKPFPLVATAGSIYRTGAKLINFQLHRLARFEFVQFSHRVGYWVCRLLSQ